MHVASAVAPIVVEYMPTLQSVHVAEPGTVLYFPAAHAVHVPPSGPVEPAAHSCTKQSPSASLPAGESNPAGRDPAGHAKQVPTPVAPTVVEYVLGPHLVQTEETAAEYLPAGQWRQIVFSEYLPASQSIQALILVSPSPSVYLPGTHSVQTEAPATAYLLYEQVTHAKPSTVYLPALHSVQTEALADEYLTAAQVKQTQV